MAARLGEAIALLMRIRNHSELHLKNHDKGKACTGGTQGGGIGDSQIAKAQRVAFIGKEGCGFIVHGSQRGEAAQKARQ